MAKYVFKGSLSTEGIENIKKQLLNYRNVTLKDKVRQISMKLAEIGIDVATAQVDSSPLGHYVTLNLDISPVQAGTRAILTAIGEVKHADGREPFNLLLALEFGAGIYYNPKPNPNASDFGLGIGTFPGQVHAFEDGWYYWDEQTQSWKYTHGVKATMPMYKANTAIITNIKNVVREVFS